MRSNGKGANDQISESICGHTSLSHSGHTMQKYFLTPDWKSACVQLSFSAGFRSDEACFHETKQIMPQTPRTCSSISPAKQKATSCNVTQRVTPPPATHSVTRPGLIGHNQVTNSSGCLQRARGIFWRANLLDCVQMDLPNIITRLKGTCRGTWQSVEIKSNPMWWLVDLQGYLSTASGMNFMRSGWAKVNQKKRLTIRHTS